MRLTRSRDDVVVAGVLAGLADYFNLDPTLLRIIFVILVFVGVGTIIPIYIAAMIIIPKEPYNSPRRRDKVRQKRENLRKNRKFNKKENKENTSSKSNPIEEDDWSDF